MSELAINPSCPRCAYDLSGHTATWDSACPVNGQCSECGLEFHWREILRQDERVNRRYIEHCRPRAIPVAAPRTLAWCILPWVFWKRVELRHQPRVGRMVLWLAMVLLGLHLAASAATAVALWRMDAHLAGQTNPWRARQLAQRQIQRQQMVSALGLDPEFRALSIRLLDNQISALAVPLEAQFLSLENIVQSLAAPVLFVRDDSSRFAQIRSMNGPYRARFASGWRISVIRFWKQRALLVGGVASIMYTSLLAMLPATRKRLRVRGVHLARASVFGMAWLVVPAGLRLVDAVGVVVNELITKPGYPVKGSPVSMTWHVHWIFWSWAMLAWISVWWLCVIWKGLRFPRPVVHWALLTLAVALAALISLVIVSGVGNLGEIVSPDQWFRRGAGPHIINRLGERMIDYVR